MLGNSRMTSEMYDRIKCTVFQGPTVFTVFDMYFSYSVIAVQQMTGWGNGRTARMAQKIHSIRYAISLNGFPLFRLIQGLILWYLSHSIWRLLATKQWESYTDVSHCIDRIIVLGFTSLFLMCFERNVGSNIYNILYTKSQYSRCDGVPVGGH